MTLDEFLFERFADRNIKRTGQGYASYCPFPWHPKPVHRHYHFHISVEKGFVKCFSCGTFMNLFEFLLWAGADWELAVKYLNTSFTDKWKKEKKVILPAEDVILGEYIPKSMLDRGFEIETLQYFEVGYNPYEKVITIPLYFRNVLVGVAYRRPPKKFSYSKGFKRSLFLYHWEPSEERYLVEGFTDTWRVWQNGSKNVSATLGAVVSEEQFDLLRKHKVLKLAFDFDLTGLTWMFVIAERLKRDVEIKIVKYNCRKDKNDPGNCSEIAWESREEVDFFTFKVELMRKFPDVYKKIESELRKFKK